MSALCFINESDVVIGEFYWVWIEMSTRNVMVDPLMTVAMPWQTIDQDGNRGPIRWEGCGVEVQVLSIVAKIERPPLPSFQLEVDAIMRHRQEREVGK